MRVHLWLPSVMGIGLVSDLMSTQPQLIPFFPFLHLRVFGTPQLPQVPVSSSTAFLQTWVETFFNLSFYFLSDIFPFFFTFALAFSFPLVFFSFSSVAFFQTTAFSFFPFSLSSVAFFQTLALFILAFFQATSFAFCLLLATCLSFSGPRGAVASTLSPFSFALLPLPIVAVCSFPWAAPVLAWPALSFPLGAFLLPYSLAYSRPLALFQTTVFFMPLLPWLLLGNWLCCKPTSSSCHCSQEFQVLLVGHGLCCQPLSSSCHGGQELQLLLAGHWLCCKPTSSSRHCSQEFQFLELGMVALFQTTQLACVNM